MSARLNRRDTWKRMLAPIGLLLAALAALSAAVGSHDMLIHSRASNSSLSEVDAGTSPLQAAQQDVANDPVPVDEPTLALGVPVAELLTLEQRRPDSIKQPPIKPHQPLQLPPVRRHDKSPQGALHDADSKLDVRRDHSWLLLNTTVARTADADFRAPVPQLLHLTYMSRSRVPAKVWRNLNEYAAGFEQRFYDDDAILAVLHEHFHPDVAAAFQSMVLGVHKADFARLALLFLYGGVYMDIKTMLTTPIHDLFPPGTVTSVLAFQKRVIYTGITAAPPRLPLFLALLDSCVRSAAPVELPYHQFTRDFFLFIRDDVHAAAGYKRGGPQPVREGLLQGRRHKFLLYQEHCSGEPDGCADGLDRYNLCCHVQQGDNRIVRIRYADFPW